MSCSPCNKTGKSTCPVCLGTRLKCCDPCEKRPGDKSSCESCRSLALKKDCRTCAGQGSVDCTSCEAGKDATGKTCGRCSGRGWRSCVLCYSARTSPCLCCCHGPLAGGPKTERRGDPCGICKGSGQVPCATCLGKVALACKPCGGTGKPKPGTPSSSGRRFSSWDD